MINTIYCHPWQDDKARIKVEGDPSDHEKNRTFLQVSSGECAVGIWLSLEQFNDLLHAVDRRRIEMEQVLTVEVPRAADEGAEESTGAPTWDDNHSEETCEHNWVSNSLGDRQRCTKCPALRNVKLVLEDRSVAQQG
jgi:hypothetical protein